MTTATEIRAMMNNAIPAAERYVAGLAEFEARANRAFPYCYSYTMGSKWIKIIKFEEDRVTGRPIHPSVHAFVEVATGSVYKAASWNAPAKGVRFLTVDDALARAGEKPDYAFTGGYLYAR